MTAGTHGSTFGGNPLAMAPATPCSTSCWRPASSTASSTRRCCFKQRLAEIKDRYPAVIAEVRGEGLLLGLRALVPTGELVDALRAEKLLTVAAGDNVVRLLPPLIISEEEIAEAISRLDRACAQLEPGLCQEAEAGGGRMSGIRHFLDLIDVPAADLRRMIEAARAMKAAARAAPAEPLAGKTLAMIFDKPSTRTRVSFDVAMRQLGGDAIMLTAEEMQLGRGETIADTARVLSRYVDAIMIRTLDARRARRAGALRHRAGDQRPDPALASLPGDGRRHDLRGASRPDPRPHRGLDRRRQQRADVLDARRRALRLPPARRDPAGARAEEVAARLGQVVRRRDPRRHRPGGGGQGRRLRRHRHLGVDGRPQRRAPPQPAQALPGQCPADGARPSPTRSSCTACRRIAARRSPTR